MTNLYFPLVAKEIQSLKDTFSRVGIKFGMSGNIDSVKRYWPIYSYHAAIGVPESSMKMYAVHPTEETWNHEPNDKLFEKLGDERTRHGHCLYWGQYYADWLPGALAEADMSGRYAILKNHIAGSMKHYWQWDSMDVVNEGFCYVYGPWVDYIGMSAIPYSFDYAKEARGDAKTPVIYYNGVFIGLPDEMEKTLELASNKKIEGIGLQWHRSSGVNDSAFIPQVIQFMRTAKSMGMKTRMSEVTIKPNGNDGDHASKWVEAVDVAIECGVSEFVQWGICDNSGSWQGDSLLFDRLGNPKPAYYAVINRLNNIH